MAYGKSAHYNSPVTELGQFTCAVCMDIFQNPVRISCGHQHVFCEDCVSGLRPVDGKLLCPQCRNPFQHQRSTNANDINILMKSAMTSCNTCGTQVSVPELRQHMDTCDSAVTTSAGYQFKPIRETSQPVPQPGPNRSTFKCPYCSSSNMDCSGLIDHCNNQHRHDRRQVVCPVCASMPWGDPNQVSINFMQHLNTRHKFEYETYVDYGQDDDAMLRAALHASMLQQ